MHTDRPIQELKEEQRKCIILPIGSCEQHGPHLPIDTDLRIAQLIAEHLAMSFREDETVVLPAIPFSCSWEHKGPGMVAFSTQTLSAILHDIAQSLKAWNMAVVFVIINWHGGNSALGSIATEITAQEGIPTVAIQVLPLAQRLWEKEIGSLRGDIHAGLLETSVMQAFWPSLVKISHLKGPDHTPDVDSISAQFVLQALGISSIAQNGVWGTPHFAQTEQGRAIITSTVGEIQRQLSKLLELIDTNSSGD